MVFMKSILVDFYNLELNLDAVKEFEYLLKRGEIPNWQTPENDKKKIIAFLDQHAIAEILLTAYQVEKKESWFDSLSAYQFYSEYRELRAIIDDFLSKKTITKDGLREIDTLARNERTLKDNNSGELFTIDQFPNAEIDFDKYTLVEASAIKAWGLSVNEITRGLINELVNQLQHEFFDMLKGKLELRRCDADDCNKIFTPTSRGKEQLFCSERCQNRIAQRRLRKKKVMF
jgi:hypothetical protein